VIRKLARAAVVTAVIASPLAIGAFDSPAEATCDPRKPSTCGCPVGFERVGPFCLPTGIIDDIEYVHP
jgi:hypothetical protein